MSNPDPLRRAARLARRMPGYRYLRRIVLPRLRSSAPARALALRIFAVGPGPKRSSSVPSDITAGSLLGGIGVERLPVVLIVLVGMPADRIQDVAAEVAEVQVLSAGFRPVFVVDTPVFAPIRRFGYVVELVIPQSSWTADQPWPEYLRRRLASMMRLYRARAVITAATDGLGEGGRAALEAVGDV